MRRHVVAAAQTCANGGPSGGAVTDALCRAAQPGGNAARAYVRAKATQTGDCSAGTSATACTLNEQADFNACCEVPMCDDADNNYDFGCLSGAKFKSSANAIPQDGTAATCCEAKVATDCAPLSQFFCAGFAAVGSSNNPCLSGTATDACNTCTGYLNEPSGGFADLGGGTAASCLENQCTEFTVETAAAKGIVIAGLVGNERTVSSLAGKGVTAAPGWTFTTMANAAVPVAATCTGTVTSTSASCANVAAFIATPILANCPIADGCTFTEQASISCETASGQPFTVRGANGMTCIMPTSAPTGTVITNMACTNLKTGTIACSTLHTCNPTTHHPTTSGISIAGPDGIPGNSDDGVKCLSEGGELTLVVDDNARVSGEGTAAGCNINMCNPPTGNVPNGYTVGDDTAGTVAGLGAKTCETGTNYATNSPNWWSAGTCTGTIDASVEGKVPGATGDCATWAAFTRTNQQADCPTGCTYDNTAATVTCTQTAGQTDTANEFVFTGCSQAKCNDINVDDDGAGGATAFSTCSKGMTLKSDLAYPCTSSTCDTYDCCVEDNGCVGNPCAGTNSACVDVLAPGVGNTCTCCDGSTPLSLRNKATGQGGCGGSIGYFGADVTSADAASSAAVVPVAGSCTACTPIANSAEADGTVDEADKMVTCTRADDSRAQACVTGAIHVDNSANGVSDVCRLECPFTEVVALIDRLHIHTDGCAAVTLAGMTAAQQTAACEAVQGCFYTPCVSALGAACTGANDDVAATCRPIYAGCNALASASNQADCDALTVKLSGPDNVLANAIASPPVASTDDVAACTFDASTNKCKYTPPAADYLQTIQRCDALLATNWAHDLRDSCDATRACPLHGAISASPPGMIAMVKAVYTAAGAPPAGTDTWTAGNAPAAAGGSGATALSGLAAASAEAAAYFLNDGNANAMTDWEVCMNIRDAVLAAPTCSAGSGR